MRDWDIIKSFISAAAEYIESYGTMYFLILCAILFEAAVYIIDIYLSDKKIQNLKKALTKKLILIICLAFATFLDGFISLAASVYGFKLKTKAVSELVCVYIVVQQALNVCRRINKMTGGALPKYTVNLIKKLGHNFDDKDKK